VITSVAMGVVKSLITCIGYLCGDCRDNKGVSALLNRCVHCSDVNSALIAALCKTYVELLVHICMYIIIHI